MFRKLLISAASTALLATTFAAPAQAQITRIKSANPNAVILDGAKVAPGSELYYLSGQLASPIDPSKAMSPNPDDFGDTKTQTISTLKKIKAQLEANGYSLSDVFKLTLFIAPDPMLG